MTDAGGCRPVRARPARPGILPVSSGTRPAASGAARFLHGFWRAARRALLRDDPQTADWLDYQRRRSLVHLTDPRMRAALRNRGA